MKGKVVTAFSCSVKVEQMCKYYGLDQETVQIGFKHIAGKMVARRFFDIGLAFKPVKSTSFLKDLNKYLSHLEGKPKISATKDISQQ